MKKFIALSLVSSALIFYGCSENNAQEAGVQNQTQMAQDNNMMTTASGLKYQILTKGSGPQAKAGNMVKVHYSGTLTNGTKFDSSYDRGEPIAFKLGVGQVIRGWDEGIALLHVGDKAKFHIPADLAYGAQARSTIPANSDLIFEVELMDVQEVKEAKPYDVTGVEAKSTATGLKYYLIEETKGAMAQNGKNVSVHYTGYLENGTKFDSSIERGSPFSFMLGAGQVIKGWDEGIALLKVGEKARLVIPSDLGYGPSGAGGVIPPNATLIFDVELVAVQ